MAPITASPLGIGTSASFHNPLQRTAIKASAVQARGFDAVDRVASASAIAAKPAPGSPIVTEAERSNYARTGRYDEVIRIGAELAARYPTMMRTQTFGTTPEGRPMVGWVASADGVFDPAQARAAGKPVLFVQGCIHPGESDGKDAAMAVMRDILCRKILPDVLKKFTLVMVPVFNVDGHEHVSPNLRPNQNGPAEKGERVTAQNYNLNRDYVKADSPEMQAMLRYCNAWDPVGCIDLHTSDGAKFQVDVWTQIQPEYAGVEPLRQVGVDIAGEMMTRLKAAGHIPVDFYPTLNDSHAPSAGFQNSFDPPRYSHGYFEKRNRLGILIETHSWRTYAERVQAQRDVLVNLFEMASHDIGKWKAAEKQLDDAGSAIAGTDVALSHDISSKSENLAFPGYHFDEHPSEISGGVEVTYDPTKKEIWNVPFNKEIVATVTVRAPNKGYYVPPAFADFVADKLRLHGVKFEKLKDATTIADMESFRADTATPASSFVEGHTRLAVTGDWHKEQHEVPAGSLFVPINQPLARLAMSILEPQAPDSLLAWGFFNANFERKEDMEPYVAEEVAREMLARDPSIRAAFEKRLREDPDFAKSPDKRLEFFYRLHPSWEKQFNLYPVFRA